MDVLLKRNFNSDINIKLQMGKIVELLVHRIPKILPQIKVSSTTTDNEGNFHDPLTSKLITSTDYITAMHRTYFFTRVVTKEVSALLCKANMLDLDTVVRALDSSWTLIFDNLVDYSKQIQSKLSVLELSRGVGSGATTVMSPAEFEQLKKRLFGERGILGQIIDDNIKQNEESTKKIGLSNKKARMSPLKSRKSGKKYKSKSGKTEEEIKKELLNKLSEGVKNFNQNKYTAYKDFDFSDDIERIQRQNLQNEIFQSRIRELMQLLETENCSKHFKEEKDPQIILEVSKRVYENMIDSSHKKIIDLREKIIHLEKFKNLKPQATEQIKIVVEEIVLKTKQLFKSAIRRPKIKDPRNDFEDCEEEMLQKMNSKMKEIASKVLELIIENRPIMVEHAAQTPLTHEKINQITEKKASKGDQYASKIIRKKIKEFEVKVAEQMTKIKKLKSANERLKAELEQITIGKSKFDFEKEKLEKQVENLQAQIKRVSREHDFIEMEKDHNDREYNDLVLKQAAIGQEVFHTYNYMKKSLNQFMKGVGNKNIPEPTKDEFLESWDKVSAKLAPIASNYQELDTHFSYKWLDYQKEALKQEEMDRLRRNAENSDSYRSSNMLFVSKADKEKASLMDGATSQASIRDSTITGMNTGRTQSRRQNRIKKAVNMVKAVNIIKKSSKNNTSMSRGGRSRQNSGSVSPLKPKATYFTRKNKNNEFNKHRNSPSLQHMQSEDITDPFKIHSVDRLSSRNSKTSKKSRRSRNASREMSINHSDRSHKPSKKSTSDKNSFTTNGPLRTRVLKNRSRKNSIFAKNRRNSEDSNQLSEIIDEEMESMLETQRRSQFIDNMDSPEILRIIETTKYKFSEDGNTANLLKDIEWDIAQNDKQVSTLDFDNDVASIMQRFLNEIIMVDQFKKMERLDTLNKNSPRKMDSEPQQAKPKIFSCRKAKSSFKYTIAKLFKAIKIILDPNQGSDVEANFILKMNKYEFKLIQSDNFNSHFTNLLDKGNIYNSFDEKILLSVGKMGPEKNDLKSNFSDQKTNHTYILSQKEVRFIKNLRKNLNQIDGQEEQNKIFDNLLQNLGVLTNPGSQPNLGSIEENYAQKYTNSGKKYDQNIFKKKKNRNFSITDGNFYNKQKYSGVKMDEKVEKNLSKDSADLGLEYSDLYSDLDKELFLQDTLKLQLALSNKKHNFGVKNVSQNGFKRGHNRSKTSFMGSRKVIKTQNQNINHPMNERKVKNTPQKHLNKAQSMQHFSHMKSKNLSSSIINQSRGKLHKGTVVRRGSGQRRKKVQQLQNFSKIRNGVSGKNLSALTSPKKHGNKYIDEGTDKNIEEYSQDFDQEKLKKKSGKVDRSVSNSPNRSARSKEDKLKIKRGMNYHTYNSYETEKIPKLDLISDDKILEKMSSSAKSSGRKHHHVNFLLMGHSLKSDYVDKYLIKAQSELEKISELSRRSMSKSVSNAHQTSSNDETFAQIDQKFQILNSYKLQIKRIRNNCHHLKCKRHFNGNVCQHLRQVRKKLIVLDRELFDDFRKKNVFTPVKEEDSYDGEDEIMLVEDVKSRVQRKMVNLKKSNVGIDLVRDEDLQTKKVIKYVQMQY